MQNISQVLRNLVLGLSGVVFWSQLALGMEGFDASGYLRTGTGISSQGRYQECIGNPGAPTNEFRLGNECGIFAEFQFKLKHLNEKEGVFNTVLKIAASRDGFAQWESEDAKNRGFNLSDVYVEAGHLKDLPWLFWVGKRTYRESDAHIYDWYYFADLSGVGAGVGDIKIAGGNLQVAHLVQADNDEGGSGYSNTGRPVTQALDLRLKDISYGEQDRFMFWAVAAWSTSGNDGSGTNYAAGKGDIFGVKWSHEFSSLNNDFAVIQGGGLIEGFNLYQSLPITSQAINDRYRLRVVDSIISKDQADSNWSYQLVMASEQSHNGNPDERNLWNSLGLRSSLHRSENFRWVMELGTSEILPITGQRQEMNRISIAPELAVGRSQWSRPVLRAVLSQTHWNAAVKNIFAISRPALAQQSSETSLVWQAEVWF